MLFSVYVEGMAKLHCTWKSFVLMTLLFNMIIFMQQYIIEIYSKQPNTTQNNPFIDGKPAQKLIYRNPKIRRDRVKHERDSYINAVRDMSEKLETNGDETSKIMENKGSQNVNDSEEVKAGTIFLWNKKNSAKFATQTDVTNHVKSNQSISNSEEKENKNQEHEAKKVSIFYSNGTLSTNKTEQEIEQKFYRKRDKVVNKFLHKYNIQPGKKKCDGNIFLVILIHSKPSYHDKRDAIRQTWGSVADVISPTWPQNRHLDVNISLIFVTGLDKDIKWNNRLKIENEMYGDVLQGDFMDDYKNMTLKSLMGLKYVSETCSQNVPYMLKSDDDMFINIPYLTQTLLDSPLDRSIMGPFNIGSKVYRRGKWRLTVEQFPFDRFPPYESGSAYLITIDIVKELYEISHFVPWIFIDDVYITGILARIVGVKHLYMPGMFSYWTDKVPKPCDIINNKKITFTKCTPQVLKRLWGSLQKQTHLQKC